MAATKTRNKPKFFSRMAEKNPAPAATCSDPLAAKYDVRNISSRQLTLLGLDLYQDGRISREELAMLTFQPELKANYDSVGARGVARPDPDLPRDALAEWREILETQTTFNNSLYFTEKTQAIIQILASLDRTRNNK